MISAVSAAGDDLSTQASKNGGGSTQSTYIPGLDGLRAVAILLVFLAHATPSAIGAKIPATLGVTIFFFLSGYLITTLLRRELEQTGTVSLRDFYLRRALRILPPLYLVYALAELLDLYVRHLPGGTLRGALAMLFYYLNYVYAVGAGNIGSNIVVPSGMSVTWSLCVEEHFYLLFPLALLLLFRARLSRGVQCAWLAAFCVLELAWRAALVLAHVRDVEAWTYYATDARLDSILFGALLAMFANPVLGNRVLLPKRGQPLAFVAAVMMLGGSLMLRAPLYRDALRYTLQGLLLMVIFSFVIAYSRHWMVRWLEWPVVRYLGWVSYTFYLCHYAIQQWLEEHVHGAPLALLVGTSVLSLTFATLLRYTVERPLQRLRGNFRRIPETDPTAPDGHGLVS